MSPVGRPASKTTHRRAKGEYRHDRASGQTRHCRLSSDSAASGRSNRCAKTASLPGSSSLTLCACSSVPSESLPGAAGDAPIRARATADCVPLASQPGDPRARRREPQRLPGAMSVPGGGSSSRECRGEERCAASWVLTRCPCRAAGVRRSPKSAPQAWQLTCRPATTPTAGSPRSVYLSRQRQGESIGM